MATRRGTLPRAIRSARAEFSLAITRSSAQTSPRSAPGNRSVMRRCRAAIVSITFSGSRAWCLAGTQILVSADLPERRALLRDTREELLPRLDECRGAFALELLRERLE